jgi:hypothetical protein
MPDRRLARLAGRHFESGVDVGHVLNEHDVQALRTMRVWVAATTVPGSLHVPEDTNTIPPIELRGPALWYVTTSRGGGPPLAFEVSVPPLPGASELQRPERDILMALLRYTIDSREVEDARQDRAERDRLIGRVSRG